MHSQVRRMLLLAIVTPFTLAGCFKLSRESPRLQLFVLSGVSAEQPVPTAAGTPAPELPSAAGATPARRAFRVGMRRVELAPYLSVPEIVMRRGANEIVLSQFHRWGGDLEQSINRTVAASLTGSTQVRHIDVAPWAAIARHDLLVQLHVSRFEGVVDSAARDGQVHVMAQWDIIRPLGGAVLFRGSSNERGGTFRVGDYGALVAGLDAALARVARDIGACIARFPNDSTPPGSCERGGR